MLAHGRRVYRGFASAEAELISRHEIRPLVNFLQGAECAREYEAANRVAIAVCAVGVKLTAAVAGGDVEVGEISNACDLDVVWSDYNVCTGDGAVRDQSCSVPALHAPCYFDSLSVSDDGVGAWLRRRPDTPVLNCVDISILALGVLIVASGAVIVACLTLLALIGSV